MEVDTYVPLVVKRLSNDESSLLLLGQLLNISRICYHEIMIKLTQTLKLFRLINSRL